MDMILIIGPTGAGKTSQAKQLARNNPNYAHIELGELLRQSTDPKVKELMKAGELVDDELVARLVVEKIKELSKEETPILDGFPRRMSQVELFEKMLENINREVECVILLKVSPQVTQGRLAKRGRLDDIIQAIRRKRQIFLDETIKVVEHYRQQGLVREVDGEDSLEEVDRRIQDALNK